MVIVFVEDSFGVVDAKAFVRGVAALSRGVPNTDVLVATGVAGMDGSDFEFRAEAKVPGDGDAKALNPFESADVPAPMDFGCSIANPDGCFVVEVSVKLVAEGPDIADPKDV
jgi:hypothetical protein